MTTEELMKDIKVLLNVNLIKGWIRIFSNTGLILINNDTCLDNEKNLYLEFLVATKNDYDYIINGLSKSNKFILNKCEHNDYINDYIIYYYVVDNLHKP